MFKLLVELGPLIAFFVGYKSGGIFAATLYALIASIISIGLNYIIERKVNKMYMLSAGLLITSGALTIFSKNTTFIMMKPSILYLIFACIMYVTNRQDKPAMKYLLGSYFEIDQLARWKQLNNRFMIFFIGMAILNEIVWRNFPEESWVNFKVFIALPLTLLFVLGQLPFMLKYAKNLSFTD